MENIYKQILDATGAAFWIVDLKKNTVQFSPTFKNALGYADEELDNNPSTHQALMFAEDFDRLSLLINDHVASQGKTPVIDELRFHHKNGSTVYFKCNAKVVEWSAEGYPLLLAGANTNITDVKVSQEKLLRVQELLTKTNQAAQVGGWEMDLITRHLTWTEYTRQIHEVDDDFEPNYEVAVNFFTPAGRKTINTAFKQAITKGKPYDLEVQMITAKGNHIWARAVGHPEFKDGKCVKIMGSLQNITNLKQAEEELRLKKDQLGSFIEYSPAAMAMFDSNMCYIAASNSWMTSYKLKGNIIGKSHYEVFPEVSDEWRAVHQRCLKGEIIKNEADTFLRLDGTVDWMRWEVRPWYDKPGTIGGVVMLTEVITDRIEARHALLKAKEAAEMASEAKSHFLSTMSHEIRTPMNAVIGLTHILLDNPREDQVENLNTLKFSAENLLVLINDILDFSKIEAGKIEFENSQFSVREVLNNIRLSLLNQATEKGVQLKLILDEELPKLVVGDPVRIGQIFTNLIGNAIKFTHVGRVTVTATLLTSSAHMATIHFEVMDTGIGIAPEKQETIFESFSQANTYIARKYGGTGLGLTITKKLLDLLGSSITVTSKENEGTTFAFDLKLLTGKKKNASQQSDGMDANPVCFDNFKLLLAEDNPINVLVARQFLKKWDITWDLAENGLIAVEMIKANHYDLVLMDLHMPELDGYSAVKIIRNLPEAKYQELPIVALTASASSADRDRTEEYGLNGYVTKPFNPDELYRILTRFRGPTRLAKVS